MTRYLIAILLVLIGPVRGQDTKTIDFDDTPVGLVLGSRFEDQGVVFSTVRVPNSAPTLGREQTITDVSGQVLVVSINSISEPHAIVNGSNSTDDILCTFTSPVKSIGCDLDESKGPGERGDIVRLIGLRQSGASFIVVAVDEEEDGSDDLFIKAPEGAAITHAILQCTTEREGFDNFEFKPVAFDIPKPLAVQINAGAEQRSMIQAIGFTFNRDVSGIIQPDHLKLRNLNSENSFALSRATLVFDPRDFSVTWMLDNDAGALLQDGNYIAWLETDELATDTFVASCSVPGAALDDFTFGFHQLTGDSDGDRDVDFKDSCALRDSWQTSIGDSGYRNWFDFDLDGSILEPDRARVELTYFSILPETPGLHLFLRSDTGESQSDNKSSSYGIGIGIAGRDLIEKLELSIDDEPFADITGFISSGSQATITMGAFDSILGRAPALGQHRIRVRASDGAGRSSC